MTAKATPIFAATLISTSPGLATDSGEQEKTITIETNNLMKILIVLTSHSELGDTGKKTGFWVEEFAAPYYELADAGAEITLTSPKGGQPPIDPSSQLAAAQTKSTHRFDKDEPLKQKLAHTLKLSDVKASDYDAVFYPGGHGPLWDLTKDPKSIALIEAFQQQGKPMALVCHAPCALLKVKLSNGDALIKGKTVTGFSDTEEAAVKLTKVVPFLLENELKKTGAHYSKGPDWGVYVQTDGLLITGQNPASSAAAAQALLKLLPKKS
jgi:putative intracellular protease/amidase